MSIQGTTDVNVADERPISTPEEVKRRLPITKSAAETFLRGRNAVCDILDGEDRRLFGVIGPCSIHDPKSAFEYADRLKSLADEVADVMVVIMRVYFAKPRTSVGWKGLINDPFLDDSFQIDEGLTLARRILLEVTSKGLPAGTEALDPITPQYIDDLVSWNAVGARTTESQSHREMASGLSTPVGFKNGTDGNVEVAVNAIKSCANPHHFLGVNAKGQCSVLRTKGNRYGHVVLRGGVRPNFDAVSIRLCEKALANAGLPTNIVVDCSHGNSFKDPSLQPLVLDTVVNHVIDGTKSIVGFMLESHLFGGNQSLGDPKELNYGVSITDACLDWNSTVAAIQKAAKKLRALA
jgi:3-deoxy-7-phosphoheptulonate synthase